MNDNELKPCPFCGGKAKVNRCLSNYEKFRLMHTCLDRTPHIEFYHYYFETRQDAIDFWNTRTPKGQIEAEAIKEFAEIIVADYPEMEYYLDELVKNHGGNLI